MSFFFSRTVLQNLRKVVTAVRESTLQRRLQLGPTVSELAGCLMRHRKPTGAAQDTGGRCKSWRSSRPCAATGAACTEGFRTKLSTAAGDGANRHRLTNYAYNRSHFAALTWEHMPWASPRQTTARFSFFIYCCTRW
jgi:hypothetical protein